jgi:MFS transporter, YNFM family, putative membrane transport protein
MSPLELSDIGGIRLAERSRTVVIAVIAFLTLVDLFATQAILPALAAHYLTTPAATGLAVNATTAGMAIGSLVIAILGARINRRLGVIASLCLLAIPTALLSVAPNLAVFATLRVAQGLCMASAFALTLAYLGETTSASGVAGAFAAYITGNVASNLVGRLVAAFLVDHYGLARCFLVFALLNLAGALLSAVSLDRMSGMANPASTAPMASWLRHLRSPRLLAAFGVGFCILFAFVGGFTYVNFVLARPPLALGMMQIGLVYLVFAPSILTTPLAGFLVARIGPRMAIWFGLAVAMIGVAALLVLKLPVVLSGLALFAVGTFFAQAVATGFVGKAAKSDRGSASGLYLSAYFLGGLAGSAVLGWAFDGLGWNACVLCLGAALIVAAVLSSRFIIDE